MKLTSILLCTAFAASTLSAASDHLSFQGKDGPGKGKHVVLISGDEEYRSEEAMPMLAKILSNHHGFDTTVLFSLAADGTIDPKNGGSLSHSEALEKADAIVMLTRFRHWDDAASKRFQSALDRGVPVIGLRTSTHAFNGYAKDSPYAAWNFGNKGGFGKNLLGETWVSHWGSHKHEATKGVIEAAAKDLPIMHGVADVFGTTDVYEAYPPADATLLFRGQVLKGMTPSDAPADYKKKRSTDKVEQGVNDPMMAVAWTREVKNAAGTTNKALCTTMGAATDLLCEDLRRLVVNSVFWGLGLEVPAKADVTFVDPFEPSMYGFDGNNKGLTPDDFGLGKATKPAAPAPAKGK